MEERKKKAELPIGQILENRWKIERGIARGTFGILSYEVSDVKNPNERYLLKAEGIVEVSKSEGIPNFLHMELKLLMALKENRAKYYLRLEDAGEVEQLRYVVVRLMGRNLEEIRLQLPALRFSVPTMLHIEKFTMLALEEIHNVGFLHRDIKPANMVTGFSGKYLRRVYLTGFHLCRKYIDERKNLRIIREKANFRGSPRYASIDALSGKEQGRVDDLWSWFQAVIEMTVGKVPVQDLNGPSTIEEYLPWLLARKIDVFGNPDVMLANCPLHYRTIYDHLRSLKVADKPNYSMIHQTITEAMQKHGAAEVQLDWEKTVTPAAVAVQ